MDTAFSGRARAGDPRGCSAGGASPGGGDRGAGEGLPAYAARQWRRPCVFPLLIIIESVLLLPFLLAWSNVIVFMDFSEDALQGYTTSHCFLNWSYKNSIYSSESQSSDTSFGGGIDWFAAEHDQVSLTYYASDEINPKVNKWQRYRSFLDSFDKRYVII